MSITFSIQAEAGSDAGHHKERGFLSKHLPEWIDVDVEARHRYEYRDNFDFKNSKDDQDGFNLWRTRVGVTLKPTKQLKLHYTFQDSRISHDSIFDTAGKDKTKFENWADTKKLYLKYKQPLSIDSIGLKSVAVKLGRQPLVYGKQRLLGDPGWSNLGTAFDAVKGMVHFNHLDFDVFGGKKTDKKIPREHDDLYEGGSKDRVGGYYATYKGFKHLKIEQYLIQRKTNKSKSFGPSASGELLEYTAGGRLVGAIADTPFDYELEAAYQWGEMGSLDISAMMVVAILGYTFDHEWSPRIAFEMDYASGDADKTDGERNTFDNLYPTNHGLYGYMDRVSLQNLNLYSLQASVKPSKKLKLQSNLHFIFLDTPNDYLYDSGAKKIRSTTGSAFSTHVGNEIDLAANYTLNKHVDFLVGYSHFFAGEMLDDSGADDDGDFAYVQSTLKF